VSVALSLMFVGVAPAQARTSPQQASAGEATVQRLASAPGQRPCGNLIGVKQAKGCASDLVPLFSEGGCGFLQRCIYFSRSEQLIILAGGGATIVALICGATALLGCAAASAVVAAAFQWLSDRGGVCPTSKPKLKVRYFPTPAIKGCVA
jgi:hypothetical protein